MNRRQWMDDVESLAREAADAAMEVYERDFDVEYKDDEENSPLTEADRRAHRIIVAGLEEITPDVPIISEESRQRVPYEQRRQYTRFWLVDPLDGTREFVDRNGEFTVNIGLIERSLPVAGVVVAPVLQRTYRTDGVDTVVREHGGETRPLRVSETSDPNEAVIVYSRSHSGPRMRQLLDAVEFGDEIARGSSLKICQVAAGQADVYCRFRPTWEWDTAAADAVLRMAGGKFTEPDGNVQLYNKPSLKNERGLLVTNGLLHETISQRMAELMDAPGPAPDSGG